MNIFVLMKRTFDTEEKILLDGGEIIEDGAEFIINPYDEYAIEEAISLKEKHGGEVTVVTLGNEDAQKELRTALAMGCDKAVLIDTEDEIESEDEYTTSIILASYLKEQQFDLIIGGNVAIDGGSGQVCPRVAELLNMACVTTITSIEIQGNDVEIIRDVEGDEEKIQAALPLVVTAQQGLNEPRYPSLPGIMKAKKKPLEEIELDDLEIEEEIQAKTKVVERFLPPEKEGGKILQGESHEQVKELVHLLYSKAKVL
ncbi:electron transfer flavoprotein subunit beta/FixA family protein [Priestia filamentosa]|uniref:electron transfer flavoprotein subunit beta/FixA family protein n=1 Tax=Priestia filamentosa TaxID=1402861 RepID=UPI001FB2E64D|nr:electron transfer flavoprotein subunit beta/FixA family protein [Priestia filamentosa]UOE61201.1 electron transfer flavoprotein subunit beta/FixA family protein [Priestia filamentosa]